MNDNHTLLVPVEKLLSSKLNPRKHFDETHINALAASMAKDGLLENLIVRPKWCSGITTRVALDAMTAKVKSASDSWALMSTGPFEIVGGECRFRAAKVAKIAALDCRVRLLTDPEVQEINLTEQMHRNQLTPLEEAQSFADLMGYRNEDGSPRHTADSLAKALSMATAVVYHRLQLLKLPAVAAKAMESGKLGMTVASLIARIPDAESATEATKAILKGPDGEPMSFRQAQAYISENCMKALNGAPFDQSSVTLLYGHAVFGDAVSCDSCPHRTGNNKERFGDVKRGDICTRPGCYAAKCEAAFAQAAKVAEADGCEVLTAEQSEKEFPSFQNPGELAFSSPYAKLDDEPQPHLLKAVVKNPPVWREIVEKLKLAGMKPRLFLARDQSGKPVELVKVEQIVTGAEKAGEPVFREKSAPRNEPRPDDVKMKAENKRLAAEATAKEKVLIAAVQTVLEALAESKLKGVWELFLKLQLEAEPSASPVWHLLAKCLKLSPVDDATIRKAVGALPSYEQMALLPVTLIGRSILADGMDSRGFQSLAKHVGVNLKKLSKELLKATAGPATSKAAAGKKKAKRLKPECTIKRTKADPGARAVAAVKATRVMKGGKK